MPLEYLGASPKASDNQVRPFSPAVRAGDFIYVSGQVPADANGEIVVGGIEAHFGVVEGALRDGIGLQQALHGQFFHQAFDAHRRLGGFGAFHEVEAAARDHEQQRQRQPHTMTIPVWSGRLFLRARSPCLQWLRR